MNTHTNFSLRDLCPPTDRATLAGEGCETPPAAASSASTLSYPARTPGGFGGKPSTPSEDVGGAKIQACKPVGRASSDGIRSTQSSHAAPLSHPRLDTSPDAATGVELHRSALLFDPCLSAQMAMGIS